MPQTPSPMSIRKKILLGSLFLLIIGLIFLASVPFWFDIDRYRPQIITAISEHLNGRMSLGKLSISFWGKFKIKIDGLVIEDSSGEKLVSAGSILGEVPVTSILSKSPSLTLVLDKPEIRIVKDKTGNMNVLSLVKSSEPKGGDPTLEKIKQKTEDKTEKSKSAENSEVEGWIKRSDFSLILNHSHLVYLDSTAGTQVEIKELNVEMERFSFNRPGKARVWANIDTRMGKSLTVQGPFELLAKWSFGEGAEQAVSGNLEVSSNFKPLDIELAEGFKKKKGEEASVKLTLNKTADAFVIQQFEVLWPRMRMNGKAIFKDILAEGGSRASVDATLSAEAPGFQMGAKARVNSLTQPRGEVVVTSSGIDLDQLFPQSANSRESQKADSNFDGGTQNGKVDLKEGQSQVVGLDKSVAALKDNSYFKTSAIDFKVDLKSLKSKGILVSDIESFSRFKSGVFSVNSLKMRLLGGTGAAAGVLNLTGQLPSYQFNSEVSGVQLEQAMASQSELLKNMLKGKAEFRISGKGESLEPEKAKLRLVAKGGFKVTEATFASLDVGKMATQALGGALVKIVEQVPLLKGKNISKTGPIDSRYEVVSSDFSLQNGVLDSPNFLAKAAAQKGMMAASPPLGMS